MAPKRDVTTADGMKLTLGPADIDLLRVLEWLNAWGYGEIHLGAKGYGR